MGAAPATAAAAAVHGSTANAKRVAVELPASVSTNLQAVMPALAPVVDSLTLDLMPTAVQRDCTPAQKLAELLGETRPCASVAEQATIQDRMRSAKASLDALGDHFPDLAANLRGQIAGDASTLEKLQKKAPSAELERSSVVAAQAAYRQDMQARKDRAKLGAEKAQKRREQRLEHIVKLRQQLDLAEKTLGELDGQLAAAFAERNTALDEFDAEVMLLFTKRITVPSDSAMDTQELSAPADDAEKLREEAAFDVTAEAASFDLLPTLEVPPAPELATCGRLYCLLARWSQAGSNVPFSFGALREHAGTGEVDALLRKLLGQQWALWFPPEGVEPAMVLPRQSVVMLFHALGQLRTSYERLEDAQAAAASSYAALAEGHSKRRRKVG
jgi:hypothetical protein